MRLFRTLPLALATALLASAAVAAPETTTTPISGTVDSVFGHQVVVATENSGKVLVDLGHKPLQPPIAVGEKLQVTGRMEGSELEARNMVRADGSTVVLHDEGQEYREPHQGRSAIGHDD